MRGVLVTISIVILLSAFSAHAKMYKWVDENGHVHFGDNIPAKYQLKAHEELSSRGLVSKHNAAAKTPAEKAVAKRLAKERRVIELAEKRARQRDRVLLDTYTTERDLIVARDARLEAVGSQIKLSETIIRDSTVSIQSIQTKIDQIKASNRTVPEGIYQQLESEQQQIKVQSKVKQGHMKRNDAISEQFSGFIKRFNALKAAQKARRLQLAKERDLI